MTDDVLRFARAILHGDTEHRVWLIEAAAAFAKGEPIPPARSGARWRHKARGSTYRVVGEAAVQAASPIAEGDLVIVYRAEEDGSLWARPSGEFHDGRFEVVP